MTDHRVAELLGMSRRVGADTELVIAGGGNTSTKDEAVLRVKASGFALASLEEEGLVALDRYKLEAIARTEPPASKDRREAAYRDGIMEARLGGSAAPRPSVEALLHHIVPGRFVLHTHATAVNVLTCAVNGEAIARDWFGDDMLWLEFVDPGYQLAWELTIRLTEYRARTGREAPRWVLMANHGLITSGDTPRTAEEKTEEIVRRAEDLLPDGWRTRGTVPSEAKSGEASPPSLAERLERALEAVTEGAVRVVMSADPVARSIARSASREVVEAGPLTPDQIVYCTSRPLWIDAESACDARDVARLVGEYSTRPKIVVLEDVGVAAIETSVEAASRALAVYLDAAKIMNGAMMLDAVHAMADEHRVFIENWEVEAYRRKVAGVE